VVYNTLSRNTSPTVVLDISQKTFNESEISVC